MKLEIGDILEFEGVKYYAAEIGARAIYKGAYNGADNEELIRVEWIRDGKDNGQDDGGYFASQFKKIEENKKVMKVDFKAGKERVVQRLISFIEDFEHDMLEDIKIIVNSDRDNKTEQVEEILDTIKTQKKYTEEAITRLDKVYSLKDILLAMQNTVFEEDEATILQAFLGVDSVTID